MLRDDLNEFVNDFVSVYVESVIDNLNVSLGEERFDGLCNIDIDLSNKILSICNVAIVDSLRDTVAQRLREVSKEEAI